VREVIAAVERITGLGVPTREVSRCAGDPATFIADATLARRLLGWRPRFVELGEIIATAWQWHASRAGARELPALSEKQEISIMAD
jgi:UDP-glucose 4-epimerase